MWGELCEAEQVRSRVCETAHVEAGASPLLWFSSLLSIRVYLLCNTRGAAGTGLKKQDSQLLSVYVSHKACLRASWCRGCRRASTYVDRGKSRIPYMAGAYEP